MSSDSFSDAVCLQYEMFQTALTGIYAGLSTASATPASVGKLRSAATVAIQSLMVGVDAIANSHFDKLTKYSSDVLNDAFERKKEALRDSIVTSAVLDTTTAIRQLKSASLSTLAMDAGAIGEIAKRRNLTPRYVAQVTGGKLLTISLVRNCAREAATHPTMDD
jgi:hypothetical protein